MTQRQWLVGLILLGVSLTFARPAEAQRSGFVIGFGLGPGLASFSSFPDRESKTGVAMDFHIGGVIDEFELYYVQKGTILSSDVASIDNIFSGVAGLGFAYPLSPKFAVTGGIGFGMWLEFRPDGTSTGDSEGVGFLAGGRYLLNESGRWALGFDITYGRPRDGFNALGVQATINVLSH